MDIIPSEALLPKIEKKWRTWNVDSLTNFHAYPIEVKFKGVPYQVYNWLDQHGYDFQWLNNRHSIFFKDPKLAAAFKLVWG
jgi:hypothetical protein